MGDDRASIQIWQSRVSGSNVAADWCSCSCNCKGSAGEVGSSTKGSLRDLFAGLWWGDSAPSACIANRTILFFFTLLKTNRNKNPIILTQHLSYPNSPN